jgi:precorrin-6A synthase
MHLRSRGDTRPPTGVGTTSSGACFVKAGHRRSNGRAPFRERCIQGRLAVLHERRNRQTLMDDMRTILIIGIGAGNPDYMTVQAIDALGKVDVFFLPDKGAEKSDLRKHRQDILARFIPDGNYRTAEIEVPQRAAAGSDYLASVDDWHARLATNYQRLFAEELAEGECGAFLVWGDPTLYDSTLRILDTIRANGFALEYEVIPGISAVQALAAQHRIALNRIGEPVLITAGRKLAEGLPPDIGTVVVMLDGEQAFKRIDPAGWDIYWGAYLGTGDEILVSGKLSDVAEKIEAVRAKAREEKGWIMDTYLLRRSEKP